MKDLADCRQDHWSSFLARVRRYDGPDRSSNPLLTLLFHNVPYGLAYRRFVLRKDFGISQDSGESHLMFYPVDTDSA